MINYVSIRAKEIQNADSSKILYNTAKGKVFAEQLAQQFYGEQGYDSKWSENNFWWTIMALLLWDAIFAKVEGAVYCQINGEGRYLRPSEANFDGLFHSFVQLNGIPYDFFSDDFYQRRHAIIDNKFKELENSDLKVKLSSSFELHKGQNCRAIENWDRYPLADLINIMQFIPKPVVLGICSRMIKDFKSFRSGLPDLIVYKQGEFFFSEVKSKNDKVSKIQEEWNDFLSTDLEQRVDIVFVNHNELQIENLKKRDTLKESKTIKISFGQSTSQKREEAITFIKQQNDFKCSGEGKNAIYSANFNTKDIETLYKMLDLTSGWKSQVIEVDGMEVKSTILRNALYCYKQKINEHASDLWCTKTDYNEDRKNKFGCRRIYVSQFDNNRWTDFGYVDTDKGEWVFDKKKIFSEIENQIETLQFCPLFKPEKVRKVIERLPDRVNPTNNIEWGFIGTDNCTWLYNEGKWLNEYFGEKEFPGFVMMTGIVSISKKDRNQIITSNKKDKNSFTITSSPKKKKAAGCFIATAIFDSYESVEVKKLRIFRDKYLLKNYFGRLIVLIYYRIGPTFARIIGKSKVKKGFLKKCFETLIRKIPE